MKTKIPVELVINAFYNNPEILEKCIKAYKEQYKKEPKKNDIFNFILVRLPTPITEYTQKEQKELTERLDFYLFQEFEEEQDHSEDVYDYLNLPKFTI